MGKTWLKEETFYKQFLADEKKAKAWRDEGMPYGVLNTGEIVYPKEECHRWHAGEDGQKGEKCAEKQKIYFLEGEMPILS